MATLLSIQDLHATVDGAEVLKGVNLTVNAGEVHAIMGPNGSGKSTLVNVLSGNPQYQVTGGSVEFGGRDLLAMLPEERARDGVFLAFQYPVELPGVRNWQFLKSAVDAVRKHRGQDELSIRQFDRIYEAKLKLVEIDAELMKRSVNEGFSGGEKKRNEMLQLLLLEPRLALLDETDSGLDIDALRVVAGAVNGYRGGDNAIVLVTHYQRLLDYIVPDFIHVLYDGRMVLSGGRELALELEAKGYDWVKEAVAAGR
ncbi:MAG: Fe-S cluster assembly ATPase SufC [Dehalococcoidia bacterium]|nr:Fe-S cluster assembly ATPase SufC [Dehalococcoidia bacterium]